MTTNHDYDISDIIFLIQKNIFYKYFEELLEETSCDLLAKLKKLVAEQIDELRKDYHLNFEAEGVPIGEQSEEMHDKGWDTIRRATGSTLFMKALLILLATEISTSKKLMSKKLYEIYYNKFFKAELGAFMKAINYIEKGVE